MKRTLLSLCVGLLLVCLLSGCSGRSELTEQRLREDLATLPAVTQQNVNGLDASYTIDSLTILERIADGSRVQLQCELTLEGKYYHLRGEALAQYVRNGEDWKLESCSELNWLEVTPVSGVPELQACADVWQTYPHAELLSRQTDLRTLEDRVMFSVDEEGDYLDLQGSVTYCYTYDNGWYLTGQEPELTLKLKPIYGLHLFQKIGMDAQHAWVMEFVNLTTEGNALVHLMHFDVLQTGTVRTWEEAYSVTLDRQEGQGVSFSCAGEEYRIYSDRIVYCDGDSEQVAQLVTRASCEWLGTYFDTSIVDSRYSLEQSSATAQDSYLWRSEQTAYDETGEVLYRSQSTYNQNGDRTSQVLTYSGQTSYYGTAYAYDDQGKILYVGFCGQGGEPITESYYSYEDGRLSQILTYDCATDALVEALEYRYDEQGRLVQELDVTDDEPVEQIVYDYDARGNLWRVQDFEQGLNFVCRYNENDRLMELRTTNMNGAFDACEQYSYDEQGVLTGYDSLNEDGTLLEHYVYQYDAAGRLMQIQAWDAAQQLVFEQQNTYVDTP